MRNEENEVQRMILKSIRKQPHKPTRELSKMETRTGVKITRFYVPRYPSAFWFQPKRILTVYYGKFTFVFLYCGILPGWHPAKKNEMKRYINVLKEVEVKRTTA